VQTEEFNYMEYMYGAPNSGKEYKKWQNDHAELSYVLQNMVIGNCLSLVLAFVMELSLRFISR
jgi:hypothetical protein